MERARSQYLECWLVASSRRPLVLRGARQVGKTWLVRDLATSSRRELFELNFERDPRAARTLDVGDPRVALGEISLFLGRDLVVDRSLLFLDEIQAAPTALAKLRWFAEELPALPVVAAGSLLDLSLAEFAGSMPVGRVGFLHIEPMGFDEYLKAHGQERLLATLRDYQPGGEFSPTAHVRASEWFERYAMVGGMPAVVAADVGGAGPRACRDLQRDLVATFRADFAKYAGRMDRGVLDHVLFSAARSLGRKFVYAHVDEGVKQHQAKRGLELLAAARVCHLVRYSTGSGIPLGGDSKDSFRKVILLDVGLFHALAGTPAGDVFPALGSLAPGVRGQLAEQLAGQALLAAGEPSGDGPELFYWQREGGRPGEIDFLLQVGSRIVPIELKAGSAGAMKSLHQFMFDKRLSFAVRLDDNPPSLASLDVGTTQGDRVSYRLLSLPHYLAWRVHELCVRPEAPQP
jgi:predicted AAA+ superfamily ATPase